MPEGLTRALTILVASFVPALAWLGYWVYRTRGLTRVRSALAMFAAGLLSGPIAIGAFRLMELTPFYEQLARIDEVSDTEKFVFAIFAIGPVEEVAKLLVVAVALQLFPRRFDARVGGPLYAAAAALGFAAIENWYYMLEVDEVVWHRALTLPFNHVLFSSFWGVGLSLREALPRSGMMWLVAGICLASVYHGLYDLILISGVLPPWLVVPLMLTLWIWFVAAIPRLRVTVGQDA